MIIVYNHKFVSIISSFSTDISIVPSTDGDLLLFKFLNILIAFVTNFHLNFKTS